MATNRREASTISQLWIARSPRWRFGAGALAICIALALVTSYVRLLRDAVARGPEHSARVFNGAPGPRLADDAEGLRHASASRQALLQRASSRASRSTGSGATILQASIRP